MQPTGLPAIPQVAQWLLAVLVICAAASDLRTRHIPNWIPLLGLTAGLVLNSYFHGLPGAVSSCVGALLGGSLLLLIYLAGGIGGGDVKLLAAIGAITGAPALLVIFVLTGLVGGGAAVLLVAVRGRLGQTMLRVCAILEGLLRLNWRRVQQLSDRSAPAALRLPYGAVIAVGTLLFLFASRTGAIQ